MPELPERIAFVDGECILCNRWVVFLSSRDKTKQLHFAAIQGVTAQATLPGSLTTDPESIVYMRSKEYFIKSSAAIRMLADCQWYWKPLLILLIIPPVIRNLIYDYVARKRYIWFGKKAFCQLTDLPDSSLVLP